MVDDSTDTDSDESDSDSDKDMSLELIRDPSTTVVTLNNELGRLGLSKTGRKRTLVERLIHYHSS